MRYRPDIEETGISEELVTQLRLAEVFSRREFVITSGYRKGDDRTHGDGDAVDIACGSSNDRWRMVQGLFRTNGVVRVGLYSAHIHVDIGTEKNYPQEVLWLGGASK